MTATPKYSSTFIFEVGTLDDEFHRINGEVARRARQIPGFLGEEAWRNEETGLHAEIYYWTDIEALRQLVGMDTHRLAKSRYGEWLGEYRVVISEVRSVYGNSTLGLEHRPEQEQSWNRSSPKPEQSWNRSSHENRISPKPEQS